MARNRATPHIHKQMTTYPEKVQAGIKALISQTITALKSLRIVTPLIKLQNEGK